ncbi:conserved hypothetical protein [uncultured Desulfobacterium sp.]|uniref:Uncharacterized protein n=1 Tax=uncultured Desulfobacterium sp. TaxID=201089 RepID=A0A445MQU4_9BACT|nr:conserved hypothetical protein [uncultured Desulfobacterium sp.]
MKRNNKRKADNGVSLPNFLSSDLRGRQSVRATFKLTEQAINILSVVASHLGIKQKSLFDHLIEDTRSLKLIASRIETEGFDKLSRIQKTYVLSKKTMACLCETSKKSGAPRDALVEYSIQRLLPIIIEERQKHEKRKEFLDEITEHLIQGEEILEKAKSALGEDDPVSDRLETALAAYRNGQRDISDFIERGRIIEEF